MISKDELDAKAKEFEIHSSNVQRDYIYGWVLMGLYSASPLKDRSILKGGNAFRKGFFETTRFSTDLDFSTDRELDQEYFRQELNNVCHFIQSNIGVVFDIERNRVEEKFRATDDPRFTQLKVLHARLYFRDFYGNSEHIFISVRMDVTQFEKLYAQPQDRLLIHPYSDSADCRTEITCVKLEELLANKIKCLLQRKHSFDLFDLVYSIFFNDALEVDKGEIVEIFLKSTIFEPSPGVVRGLLLGLSLDAFRRFWDEHLVCPIQSRFEFDKAIELFRQMVEELFGGYPVTSYGELAYFSSDNRNAILEAGRAQTLLRLRYQGYTREVEPYSLIYKKPRGRPAREYFYAWDRSGGHSGVGIKAFVQQNVGAMEVTDESFEPRYEVEVAKAGNVASTGYFAKPFSRGGRTSTRRLRSITRDEIIYIVECPYCLKTFRRNRSNTRLNKHKDHYGNQCYGRTGTLVNEF